MKVEIGGVLLRYTTINDLQDVAKAKLAELEKKIKKAGDELKKLRRQRRALKLAIEGKRDRRKAKQPAATA